MKAARLHAYHEALNAAFREIAAKEPLRCVLIDASGSTDKVAGDIWNVVRKRLDPATAPMTIEEIAR